MTDQEFVDSARAITLAVLTACQQRQADADEAAALASAALAEVLAQLRGPFGAVERLRDLADILEAQMLVQSH